MEGSGTGTSVKAGENSKTLLHKKYVEDLMDAGVRKTTFYHAIGESLAKTQGQPQQIRRALAFEHLLDTVKLDVFPHEVLGGSILGMWPVDPCVPSYEEQYAQAEAAIEAEINPADIARQNAETAIRFEASVLKNSPSRWAMMARDNYDANIDYTRLQRITREIQKKYEGSDKITPQYIAKTLEFTFQYDYGAETMRLMDELPWITANHLHLNYGMIITTGYGKLLEKIDTKLAETVEAEKREFYTAARISVQAAIRYIKRYAAAYREAAETERDAGRARELTVIAETLEKVAVEKADSFREAMQLMWITHIIANTALGSALSFGRFDQYMYPFYKTDMASGAITSGEVQALLCCMMLKVNEPKMRTVQSVTLGGTTPDGKDAANDLTRAFLEAARVVKLPYPNIAVRVAESLSPEWLYRESLETISKGFGMPMLVNDDVWIKNFTALGHSTEQARNYYNMGCVEMLIMNKHTGWVYLPKTSISYPVMLGDLFRSYKEGSLKFNSFDDLLNAYLDIIRERIRDCRMPAGFKFPSSSGCDPFGSLFIDGCLEKGIDMFRGGPEIPAHIAVGGKGLATAVDSLMAIKTAVYDQKKITLDGLLAAVEQDFKGQEALYQYILNRTDHYGNDVETADRIGALLFETFTGEVFRLNDGTIPEKYVSSFFSYTDSVSSGEITPTTPDGRLGGAPLSDGLGPSQGRDTEGPTKLLNTLLKLNYSCLNGSLATNIKVNPSLFNTQAGRLALQDLLRTYLRSGGPQIQVNFVTQEDLLDAQINPQKHRDLVVRIAGFCEYFIYLDVKQQDEVIMRTLHSVA
jgi:formate C-acetyltransferase